MPRARYTEAKLAPICAELFRDLDCDAVDFVDNYDGTMKEPALLPTTFPNVLVSANQGIAVGMASQICGFNLAEVCDTTIAYLKNPDHDIASTLLAPDFPTGGQIICDRRTSCARDLRDGARRPEGPRALALRQEGKRHRDLRDSLLHLHRGHSSTRSPSSSRPARSRRSATCATRRTCPA